MTVSLLKTARANRIEALAYLDRLRASEKKDDQIVNLSFVRASRKPKPMFTSCRAETDRMAA